MPLTRLYGEFSKVEKQDDGTIKVFGYASSGAVDGDGEIITPEAMKAALPDYMKFGAVREMHQAKAAGTAIEAEVQEDGRTFFGAHIVDAEAVRKIQTGVYKGFSIGGKVTKRNDLKKSQVEGIRLDEISLVDRPCNPDAVFTLFKADGVEPAPDAPEEGQDSGSEKDARAEAAEVAAPDLEKGGARFSSATKEALKAAHDALLTAEKALDALDYGQAGQEDSDCAEKSAQADSLAKIAMEIDLMKADLARISAERDIVKAESETLKAKIEKLESEPAPAKGFLKTAAINKSEDANILNKKEEPALGASPEERALAEIRKVHSAGRIAG